jgi:hypothetical protein
MKRKRSYSFEWRAYSLSGAPYVEVTERTGRLDEFGEEIIKRYKARIFSAANVGRVSVHVHDTIRLDRYPYSHVRDYWRELPIDGITAVRVRKAVLDELAMMRPFLDVMPKEPADA